MTLLLPVSPAEILDRIAILEIRLSRLTDPDKVSKVHRELMAVRDAWNDSGLGYGPEAAEIMRLWRELWEVNFRGWVLEDKVREMEGVMTEFSWGLYVEKCRGIHSNNDERSRLKRAINDLLGSDMLEEKIHGGTT